MSRLMRCGAAHEMIAAPQVCLDARKSPAMVPHHRAVGQPDTARPAPASSKKVAKSSSATPEPPVVASLGFFQAGEVFLEVSGSPKAVP